MMENRGMSIQTLPFKFKMRLLENLYILKLPLLDSAAHLLGFSHGEQESKTFKHSSPILLYQSDPLALHKTHHTLTTDRNAEMKVTGLAAVLLCATPAVFARYVPLLQSRLSHAAIASTVLTTHV